MCVCVNHAIIACYLRNTVSRTCSHLLITWCVSSTYENSFVIPIFPLWFVFSLHFSIFIIFFSLDFLFANRTEFFIKQILSYACVPFILFENIKNICDSAATQNGNEKRGKKKQKGCLHYVENLVSTRKRFSKHLYFGISQTDCVNWALNIYLKAVVLFCRYRCYFWLFIISNTIVLSFSFF